MLQKCQVHIIKGGINFVNNTLHFSALYIIEYTTPLFDNSKIYCEVISTGQNSMLIFVILYTDENAGLLSLLVLTNILHFCTFRFS